MSARIRSRSAAALVENIHVDGDLAEVTFTELQRAIAPGQTIAFYCGDVVVGAGVIDRADIG